MKRSNPAACSIQQRAFHLDGKPVFLHSAEMHYFRVPRKYWRKHLEAMREAGCQAVSTYIPWSWHEMEENTYDFTGETHPERDLKGFVREAADCGLKVTLKPGPYALAELTDQGMPGWVTTRYPETLALGEDGRPWGPAFISYPSPVFRRIAAKWLKKVCREVLLPAQKAGHLIMVQLCNEIGMFHWLRGGGDYSESGLNAWYAYLAERYPNLQDLADLLDRPLYAYTDVAPPKDRCATRRMFVLYTLWHEFHRRLYADYVDFLMDVLTEAKINVPRFTNVGGWVYGRAHEVPLNGTFQHLTAERQPEVLFGIDHIPEFISPNNLHDAVVANQICTELQRDKLPLYSAEFQCGSREFGVQTYPGELGLFTRLCMAHGLTGLNHYMFSQGRNPKGRGSDGPTFYWYNAVNYQGVKQPMHPEVAQIGKWLKQNGPALVQSTRKATLGVPFYPPQHQSEFLTPILHKVHKLDSWGSGLSFDRNTLRDRCWFDSLLRTLNRSGQPYDLPDLHLRSAQDLAQYDQLALACDEIMDAHTQQKLLGYVRGGGTLTVFPTLPRYDLELKPCTILRDAFGYALGSHSRSNRIRLGAMKDVPVMYGPIEVSMKKAKVIAKDIDNRPVGLEAKAGKGTLRLFSFFHGYSIEEHPRLWEAMLNLKSATREVQCDNSALHTALRRNGDEGFLFVGNFHRMPHTAHLRIQDGPKAEPLDLGCIELPMLSGLILPINHPLSKKITLRFAHGELTGEQTEGRTIRFTLQGRPNTTGILELKTTTDPKEIRLDGAPVNFESKNGLIRLHYTQSGKEQSFEIIG
ncbi:MAG: beta-galactosidase [Kiritimatiellae bacterium]|nr:beta-galactosidase [Kiritimatiellia bacterium]